MGFGVRQLQGSVPAPAAISPSRCIRFPCLPPAVHSLPFCMLFQTKQSTTMEAGAALDGFSDKTIRNPWCWAGQTMRMLKRSKEKSPPASAAREGVFPNSVTYAPLSTWIKIDRCVRALQGYSRQMSHRSSAGTLPRLCRIHVPERRPLSLQAAAA
jgi:hypothetical protein